MAVIGGNQGTWPLGAVLCGTTNFLLRLLGHNDSRGNVAGSVSFSFAAQVLVLCHSDGEDVAFVGTFCFLLCDGDGGGGGGGGGGGVVYDVIDTMQGLHLKQTQAIFQSAGGRPRSSSSSVPPQYGPSMSICIPFLAQSPSKRNDAL